MIKELKQYYLFKTEKDEKILYSIRKHWFILAKSWLRALVSFLIIILILILTSFRVLNYWLLILILGIWFLVTLVYAFYEWLIWYLDLYIITNKRIVDIEQKSLFLRQISETSLDKIQDITFEITGFWATLLNFGTLKIETAGKETAINFDLIKNPSKIQKIIFNLQNNLTQNNKINKNNKEQN